MFDFDWFDDFDWLDIGLAGAMGEELSQEDRDRREIEKDYDLDQEDEEKF